MTTQQGLSMSSKTPLNVLLYNRIKATFKHVRLGNEGEKQDRQKRKDFLTGKEVVDIKNWGEYYAVCCPFCNDTRFRCLINHLYGTMDEFNRKQTRLAVCFNAGCTLSLKDAKAYEQLENMLTGHKLFDLTKAQVIEGSSVDIDSFRMNWPGAVTRLDKLPEDHEAVVWLKGVRDFDSKKLGSYYNVHWCYESSHALCRNRIVIPIYHNKKMVGFQTRAPYDIDWKLSNQPKYYTAKGTPKRHLIYNFGNMLKCKTAIIVEGVPSVWRGGDHFGAVLGPSVSNSQLNLITKHFSDGSCVLLMDPDLLNEDKKKVLENLKETERQLSEKLKGGCCSVWLPENTDPADFKLSFLRDYITQEAKKQGVIVDWKKR